MESTTPHTPCACVRFYSPSESCARAWEYRRSRAQTRTRSPAFERHVCICLCVCVCVCVYMYVCIGETAAIYTADNACAYTYECRVGANEVKMSLEKRRTSTTARGGHPWLVSADRG
uniref:Uncharacterized protein n=1 Tax=Trichogramma kaykai TaxID=54128 RepID=A0ABD2X399_9HYME